MSAWTLTWTWAGITQTSPVSVEWTDVAELTGVMPVRTAAIVLHPLGVDVLQVAAGAAARAPGAGTLKRNGVEVLSGLWREVGYRQGAISLTIGERADAPDVLWPSPSVVIRHQVAEGVRAGGKGKHWTERAFQVIYRIPTDTWGPVVFGAPGDNDAPGSPAYLLDPALQDYGDGLGETWRLVIHRGSRPAATEVQMWMPSAQSTDRLELDARGDGVATAGYYLVRHALDDQGYPYAYVSVPPPTAALSGGVVVITGPLPSPDRPAAVTWSSGGALPGGAGSVLAFLLAQSGREVDLQLWAAAADYLDRYELAGYVDQRTDIMALVASIAAYLPVAAIRGPRGLEPRIHPWAHGAGRPRPIEAGRGFGRIDEIREGAAPATSVEVRYAVGPVSPEGARSYVLGATPYAAIAEGWGVNDVVIRADWVWAAGTAGRVASDAIRLHAGGRRLAYSADPEIYDAGGSHPLQVGDVVALTDADAYLSAVTCYVARVEASATRMRVELVARDDLLGAA